MTAPQNLDAEEMVLGAMLLSAKAIQAVADEVTAQEFYRASHGTIFTTALALEAKGDPVDAITVTAELEQNGQLDEVGGRARINELAALVPSTSSAAHYARLVRESARRRSLMRAGQQIAALAADGNGSTDELTFEAEKILTTSTRTAHSADFTLLADLTLDGLLGEIAEAVKTGAPIFGARTGFTDLDATLSGFHPGQSIVIAARPGVGKSLLAQNIAENLADRGVAVGFFSLEMSKRELQLRSLCRKTKIDLRRIRTGKVTGVELDCLRSAAAQMAKRPLYVEVDPSLRPAELRARARRMKQKHGLGLLVVDYLQLMIPEEARQKKNDEVAAISRSLKLLAKELEIPVVVISQLNRNSEFRSDKRPTLADLRDSGAIEQDADVVLFIHREDTYKDVTPEAAGEAEIIVAKNRMGEQGTVKLLFLGRRQTFATPAREGGQSAPE